MKVTILFMIILIIIILSTFLSPNVVETMLNNTDDAEPNDDDDNDDNYDYGYENYKYDDFVRKEDIKSGDEDLYILKSKIVPPVCPKCPDAKVCPRKKPCPPCPPCARCPEPAFTCKKVPNYQSTNASKLPMPWLNSFNQF